MSTQNKKTATKPKILTILGPNASGKSELGVQLATIYRGEIISADSRQVYRELNLTAGKVPGKWERRGRRRYFVYNGVSHHLVDLVSPKKQFNVQKYKKKAEKALSSIKSRGKLPIIVGGTGLYLDSIVYDLNLPKVPPNKKLRKDLESMTTDQLVTRLKALDSRRLASIDIQNRRRLIRAIEIVVATGSKVPLLNTQRLPKYDALLIGIRYPDSALKERIKNRLRERLDAGMIDEVKRLHKRGLGWQRLEDLGLEFRIISSHLKGNITLEEAEKQIEKESWHFAKRQMTWFKRDPNIIWIDTPEKAFPIVQDFLAREGEPLLAQSET